jgi:hypothetical protein
MTMPVPGRLPALFACLLFTGLAACNEPIAPTQELGVTLTFGVNRPAFHPAFSGSRADGQLTIRGTFETLCQPSTGDAAVSVAGTTLTLNVSATPAANCSTVVEAIGYDAVITGASSVRTVRVVHSWPGIERGDLVAWQATFD